MTDPVTQATSKMISHPGIACIKCHSILPFVEYGHKIGKNGKPAKWPIYEKCKNPDCKVGRKNLGVPEFEEPEEIEVKPLKPATTGKTIQLFQMTNRTTPTIFFEDMWDAKGSGTRVMMHREDIDKIFKVCTDAYPSDITKVNPKHPPVKATKTEEGLTLSMGARNINIYPTNWKVTRGYGYYKVEP